MVLIDLWARKMNAAFDCFADLTWVAYCGAEPPAKARRSLRHVAAGRDAAVRLMQERRPLAHTVTATRSTTRAATSSPRAGYGDAFFHRTGHSLGVKVHYNGVNIDNYETQDRRSLMPHVLFTIEPGVYLPTCDFDGSGRNLGLGIRSEINCLATRIGVEVTTLPLQTEIVTLM
jgi:Xaa-Pro dipeptidase